MKAIATLAASWWRDKPTKFVKFSPCPVLIIAGENEHSRYFSEDAHKAAAEPKEVEKDWLVFS